MATAASIDVVLAARTEKFQKDMARGEAAVSRFGRVGRSISSSLGEIGKRFQEFSPAKIIASFIAFESIKKVVEEIKKLMSKGFFDAQTTMALESIGKSWTDIKNQALTVVAKIAEAFAPAITTVLSGWAEIFKRIADYVGEVSMQIREWAGAPEVVGLSDSAQARVRSGELAAFRENLAKETESSRSRAAQLTEQFTPTDQKIRRQLAEVEKLFSGGFIDESTAQAAIGDLNKQWQDFINEGKKATEEYNKRQLELARKANDERIKLEKDRQAAAVKAMEAAKKAEEDRQQAIRDSFDDNVLDPLRERATNIDRVASSSEAPSATAGSVDFATRYLDIQRENENREWKAKQLSYLQQIANTLAKQRGIPLYEAVL